MLEESARSRTRMFACEGGALVVVSFAHSSGVRGPFRGFRSLSCLVLVVCP